MASQDNQKTVISGGGDVAATAISDRSAAVAPSPASGSGLPPSPVADLELVAELGRGGMGIVYKARQSYLDRTVALKLLLVHDAPGADEFVRRFQREAKILASLSHAHIVGCYQAGLTAAGHPYLVMEFIDGPNLHEWVAAHGALAPAQAALVIRDLAQALDHAHHHGIIHRDVKPENVLLAKKPNATADDPFPWIAKLVDLGLARPSSAKDGGDMNLTRQGAIMGTPATMAPEQFDDPDHVDFRADIYGLGCVLHHALTGQPAFDGKTIAQLVTQKIHGIAPDPSRLRADLPGPVRDLATWMLARDRDARPASYRELIARCDLVAAGGGQRGSKARWIGVAAGVIVLGAAAFIALNRSQPTAAEPPAAVAPPAPAVSVPVPAITAPVPVTVPVVVAEPALETVVFGPAKPLWLFDQAQRLKEWTIPAGTQWTSAEERDSAVTGTMGRISRLVGQPLPWRIDAVLHLANQPGRRSDSAHVGVLLASGASAGVTVINLGKLFHSQVNTYKADDDLAPVQTRGPLVVPPGEATTVSLVVGRDALLASVEGTRFERIALASPPVGVYLGADAKKGPVDISGLALRVRGETAP